MAQGTLPRAQGIRNSKRQNSGAKGRKATPWELIFSRGTPPQRPSTHTGALYFFNPHPKIYGLVFFWPEIHQAMFLFVVFF